MICLFYEEFHEKSWSCEVILFPTKQDRWIQNNNLESKGCYFGSRKEATIAAIDAALEYLANKNDLV